MRRIIPSLAIVAAVAFVLLVLLWIRGKFRTDSVGYQGGRYSVALEASDGVLVVMLSWSDRGSTGDGFWRSTREWLPAGRAIYDLTGLEEDEGRRLGRFGSGGYDFDDRPGSGVRAFWFPLWLPLLMTVVLPTFWVWRRLS